MNLYFKGIPPFSDCAFRQQHPFLEPLTLPIPALIVLFQTAPRISIWKLHPDVHASTLVQKLHTSSRILRIGMNRVSSMCHVSTCTSKEIQLQACCTHMGHRHRLKTTPHNVHRFRSLQNPDKWHHVLKKQTNKLVNPPCLVKKKKYLQPRQSFAKENKQMWISPLLCAENNIYSSTPNCFAKTLC